MTAAFAESNYSPPYAISTLAGEPSSLGSADGVGAAARFYEPEGAAVDPAGNVYVADTYNDTVRKITPAGVVTTLAGSPRTSGTADGTGGAARFDLPEGVAVDSGGNVYVADTENHLIRKITPAGAVTTLAGSPRTSGTRDGTGGTANFSYPHGVAVDGAGNVYVADTSNSLIRKVSPAGVVTTLAGSAGNPGYVDGTGGAALFNFPQGVAVDGAGNVYVADTGNNVIRKITPAGAVTTLAGTQGSPGHSDGAGGGASFLTPRGIACDANGDVYVADTYNGTVRIISPAGVVSTLAGSPFAEGDLDATGSAAKFDFPDGIAVDTAGNVYVADTYNDSLRKVTPAGSVSTLAGPPGGQPGGDGTGVGAWFGAPLGLAVDALGNIYVADAGLNTIRKSTSAGVVTTLAGSAADYGSADGSGSSARFAGPAGVAVDSAGNVYVADTDNDTIRRISPSGVVTTLAGLAGNRGSADGVGSAARFWQPRGIAAAASGNLYVADTNNDTVRKITPDGTVTTLAGTAGSIGSADGIGASSRFALPASVAVDLSENVYVADEANSTIRKITPAGVVSTLAGSSNAVGAADGSGTAASFDFIYYEEAGTGSYIPEYRGGIAVDSAGNVYVAEAGNSTIRKIAPSGLVTTLAGIPAKTGNVDASGALARLYWPGGIAVGNNGTLYVADTANRELRSGVATTATPPVITVQPRSAATAPGGAFSFSVTATSNVNMTYQWYHDDAAIAGQTGATLTVSNVQSGDTGSYTVVVSNAAGSVTSSAAQATLIWLIDSPPSEGGGGGGAPSWWSCAALAAAVVLRSRLRRRRADAARP